MRLSTRDLVATLLVAVALLVYGAWLLGVAMPGLSDVTTVAVAVLVLGIGASLSAVVPGFAELLRGSRVYLSIASALGLVAFGGGLWALFAAEPYGLALLALATIVLWGMSTWRHMETARSAST